MADNLNPAQRPCCMPAVKGQNTAPERLVRSILHGLGCRFSLHRTDLAGKPDIVMPSRECIVFVHGASAWAHLFERVAGASGQRGLLVREIEATVAAHRRALGGA